MVTKHCNCGFTGTNFSTNTQKNKGVLFCFTTDHRGNENEDSYNLTHHVHIYMGEKGSWFNPRGFILVAGPWPTPPPGFFFFCHYITSDKAM